MGPIRLFMTRPELYYSYAERAFFSFLSDYAKAAYNGRSVAECWREAMDKPFGIVASLTQEERVEFDMILNAHKDGHKAINAEFITPQGEFEAVVTFCIDPYPYVWGCQRVKKRVKKG